jgi:hypothetical protein
MSTSPDDLDDLAVAAQEQRQKARLMRAALWLLMAGVALAGCGPAAWLLGMGLGLGGKGQHEELAWSMVVGGFGGAVLAPVLVVLAGLVALLGWKQSTEGQD